MNNLESTPPAETEENQPDYLNKSLDKALSILDLFNAPDSKLSTTEIAKKFDTNPSSLYPILHTLEKHGYLKRDGNKLYSLGLTFAKKGRLVLEELNLTEEARSELERLRDEANKTVHLGYLNANQVVYIDKVESKGVIRMYSSPGKTAPIHATALGKVMLAFLPEEQIEETLGQLDLEPSTDKTITSPDKLRQELKIINERGYAVDDEEFEKGIRCVAAPIYQHNGKVDAAISVTGLAAQINIEKLATVVKKYGGRISSKLGYEV